MVLLSLIVATMICGMGWWQPPPDEPDDPPAPSGDKVAVLMVHGLWGSGSAMNTLKNFLEEEGWADSLLYNPSMPVDNSSLCNQSHPEQVAKWIDDIIADHPDRQIALIGHSRGGLDIMQAVWQELFDLSKVKYVITLSGANRVCTGSVFPRIPSDETPGDALYTSIWGDPVEGESFSDCDQTHEQHARIEGATNINMNALGPDVPYCHSDMNKHPDVLEQILGALNGEIGSN